jgi:uncharacterized protein (DUF1697 family)
LSRLAALLQGVNLAGKRRVAMPELRDFLEEQGYEDVRTHLASGNVILTTAATPRALEKELSTAISERFGAQIPVLVRAHAELARVVALDPLGSVADNPSRYLVGFLSRAPRAGVIRELESAAAGSERVELHGRELYTWHPDGAGRSKLAAMLTGKRLGVVVTARNWNTVTKLLELTGENRS